MKLLVIILSLHVVAQGHVGSQSVEEDAGTVDTDWSEREVGHLLTRFMHIPDVAERLRRLRGKWPFKATFHCRSTKTRDMAYRKLQDRDFKLRNVPSCGINQLTGSVKRDRRRLQTQLIDKFLNVAERRCSQSSAIRSRKRISGGMVDRVVGGQMIMDGAWPWLAAVGSMAGGPRCGGSLIADRWVITAAHCFDDVETPCSYNVRLGSRNWLYDNKGSHVDITVQAIYRHPDYDADTKAYDVALLKLLEPASLTLHGPINAVCLPANGRSLPVGSVCMAAGWGKITENSLGRVFNARQVELPIMSYEDRCGKYHYGTMQPGMLCAGYAEGKHDTCQGDSGGPLTHIVDGRWTLIGLTSFGDGCARPGYPGVYTDVGHHLKWIASVLDRFG